MRPVLHSDHFPWPWFQKARVASTPSLGNRDIRAISAISAIIIIR
jgi:hypothetical protein